MSYLSSYVKVSKQFQRSVRIDLDFGAPEVLGGYICQESARNALESLSLQYTNSRQRAFTFTGPYGGGKSFLALMLATLLGGSDQSRKEAAKRLGEDTVGKVKGALGAGREPWIVIPVVGSKQDPTEAIGASLLKFGPHGTARRVGPQASSERVIEALIGLAGRYRDRGVLLVVDELGKFLEQASGHGGDIFFFQQLAEAASRCNGRLLIIGILHQAFEQYATRLGTGSRDEWAKVQGRYSDIPLIAGVDEVIALTGRAIESRFSHVSSIAIADVIAETIKSNRPSVSPNLAERLDQCWPLHPVTASLLGPVSRRRFGQNERSTFGFLTSAEPGGFRAFLGATVAQDAALYGPSSYWDYLRVNLEPAILSSPDGHRWAQGVEAVLKAEARGSHLHAAVMKSIALIDLFRNGSGLAATDEVLVACFSERPRLEIESALKDLVKWSAATFRKHSGSWAVFDGSDFDIDSAVARVRVSPADLDVDLLKRFSVLPPVLAKKTYYETGSLRWFGISLSTISSLSTNFIARFIPEGAAGEFALVVPGAQDSPRSISSQIRDASRRLSDLPVALGLPSNGWILRDLGSELLALEEVRRQSPQLDSDSVARRELSARIALVSGQFEEELRSAISEADWYVAGEKQAFDGPGISSLASQLSTRYFPKSPVIRSELVNRQKTSSNVQAAVRLLIRAMVTRPNLERLGFEGFSAERGLYETCLFATGLHGKLGEGEFGFARPSSRRGSQSFAALWEVADELTSEEGAMVSLDRIYEGWSKPPFGMRSGVLPIIALSYVLSNSSSLAVYKEGEYQTQLSEIVADVLLQDSSLVGIRRMKGGNAERKTTRDLASVVARISPGANDTSSFAIARELVRFVRDLPTWSKRTTTLSPKAQELRRTILSANDPNKLVFADIPYALRESSKELAKTAVELLLEMAGAYDKMLGRLLARMLNALDASPSSWASLQERARVVSGISGDLRLDAFASRLLVFDGSTEEFEGIVSLAINKPPRDWTDKDPDAAIMQIGEWARQFRRAEVLASIQGRPSLRHSMGVVIGTGATNQTFVASVELSEADKSAVATLAASVKEVLDRSAFKSNLRLAALMEAGAVLVAHGDASEE